MLTNILRTIERDGYISRSQLAKELGVVEGVISLGIDHLLQLGYLVAEDTGEDCASTCPHCPFARNCSKEIVKVFRISEEGRRALGNKR